MPRYYRGHEIFTLRNNLTLLTQNTSHTQVVHTNLSSFQRPLYIQELKDDSQELVKCALTRVCPLQKRNSSPGANETQFVIRLNNQQ